MKISVVVPAYNEEKYIARCLTALHKQKHKPDEIIVVDNNSTDKTAQIAKSFGAIVLTQKQQGITPTRNFGFDTATSDIIARSDADSIPDENWISELLIYFKKHKKTGAVLGSHFYEGIPDVVNSTFFMKYIGALEKIFGHLPLLGPNMAIRKVTWEKVRPNLCISDKDVHEDFDLAIHLNKIGEKIDLVPSAIVHTSTRRIVKNPYSFFIEYPNRAIMMLKMHNVKILKLPDFKEISSNVKEFSTYIKKYIQPFKK